MRGLLMAVVVFVGCSRGAKVMRVEGMALPESAIWDPEADVYLVSNIVGEPFATDDNGFIARVSPEGKLVDRWIDGASPDVTLHAPRGLALAGDLVLVADLGSVRAFDRRSGRPVREIPVAGAVMLNDLVVRGDRVLASDSGLPPKRQPAGARHAIYELDPKTGAVTTLLAAEDLGRPNGLAVRGEEVWVATYGSGELYRLCGAEICDRQRLPGGGLDGIVVDGTRLYVSSWEAEAVFAGEPGGAFTPLIEKVASAADIGFDAKRRRLLLPLLEANVLEIRPLPEPH